MARPKIYPGHGWHVSEEEAYQLPVFFTPAQLADSAGVRDGTALFESYLAGAFAEKTDDVRVQRLVALRASWNPRLRRIRKRRLAIELERANVTLSVTA